MDALELHISALFVAGLIPAVSIRHQDQSDHPGHLGQRCPNYALLDEQKKTRLRTFTEGTPLKGADILFSPSATLDEHGYWRVRHCAQARCIEDQVYVTHCSLLGDIGGLTFWGMASILTPCDKGFPQKGIAAESASNEEKVISAEVETDMLYEIRKAGAATTLKDRRWDMIDYLYKFESEEPSGSKNRV
jgi:hypothetical protein